MLSPGLWAPSQEVNDTACNNLGLACAGAGNELEIPAAEFDGAPLGRRQIHVTPPVEDLARGLGFRTELCGLVLPPDAFGFWQMT